MARTNGVNGRSFTKLYKDKLSGFRGWKQLAHAEEYVLYGPNIGIRALSSAEKGIWPGDETD